ncbi:hypothetical protein ABW21_db0208321 [Orbilia brochopaga]|nr:hypothetical protein ABW21_db0208321 [Drechslerella brochopaga]
MITLGEKRVEWQRSTSSSGACLIDASSVQWGSELAGRVLPRAPCGSHKRATNRKSRPTGKGLVRARRRKPRNQDQRRRFEGQTVGGGAIDGYVVGAPGLALFQPSSSI